MYIEVVCSAPTKGSVEVIGQGAPKGNGLAEVIGKRAPESGTVEVIGPMRPRVGNGSRNWLTRPQDGQH